MEEPTLAITRLLAHCTGIPAGAHLLYLALLCPRPPEASPADPGCCAVQRPYLAQLGILVLQEQQVLLKLLHPGLCGHLLQLQLLPGTLLGFQVGLQLLCGVEGTGTPRLWLYTCPYPG